MANSALRVRLLLITTLALANVSAAQETSVSGTVRDQNTHREIRGVNVFAKGTKIGASSDFAGRYALQIPGATRQTVIVFRHIAYEPREISLDSLRALKAVYLQPRVITLPSIEVEAQNVVPMEIAKDLPQPTAVIDAKSFEIRGYVDAGDLLKTDQSVQVEEELSGKKTVAIRGGNPDEVVVLYNGVKMNSAYDNVFDLALIDLEDIERFEIIKGSNTALYGPEAFSGVINIVPKVQQDYHLRFNQRLGTYRSGNWGVHLYEKYKRLNGSYSFKRGASKRTFVDDSGYLDNLSLHHTANLLYSFSERPDGTPVSSLGAMYIYTALDYDSRRDLDTEDLSSFNQLFSLKYAGNTRDLFSLDMSATYRRLEEDLFVADKIGTVDRSIWDRELFLDLGKRIEFDLLELLFGYQFRGAKLDYENFHPPTIKDTSLVYSNLQRQHHGFVAIAKLHGKPEEGFLKTVNVDLSLRRDQVYDEQRDPVVQDRLGIRPGLLSDPVVFGENRWRENMFKFAVDFGGYSENFTMNAFLSFGTNVKFPTLFQQVSKPELLCFDLAATPNLKPERNNSKELGFVLSRDVRGQRAVYGWQIKANYFQNHYDNKFRLYTKPGSPVVSYDNVLTARISGLEGIGSVFLFRKKVTVEAGLSRFFISDKAAFLFKSDFKRTFNLIIDHAGYSFQIHGFKEGEQFGRVPDFKDEQEGSPNAESCEIEDVLLPAFSNLDLHLSKTFAIGKLKLFGNASARNLLNDSDLVLDGIALRDRRYYLTFGAQY